MPSQLEEEIKSQPEIIARLLDREAGHIASIVAQLPEFHYALIAARGSSDNAATYATYAWAALANYPVALATPSLHTLYHMSPRMDGALVVGISQSGQSPDIVAVLEEGKRQGRPTLAITNDASSPLAAAADHVIELHAGPERSIAATKTYTAQLVIMAFFAAAWRRSQQHLDEIRALPEALAKILPGETEIAQRAERYRYMDQCIVIGRGFNYATSFELALKLKELNYLMTTPYSSADFRHGPIATVEEGTPVILIMPGGAVFDDMLELAQTLRKRGAELLVISDRQQALSLATTPLPLASSLSEWLSPVTSIVPGQFLALHLALVKGLDPDTPRGLYKVTRTF